MPSVWNPESKIAVMELRVFVAKVVSINYMGK
jgi:hypothetical protein